MDANILKDLALGSRDMDYPTLDEAYSWFEVIGTTVPRAIDSLLQNPETVTKKFVPKTYELALIDKKLLRWKIERSAGTIPLTLGEEVMSGGDFAVEKYWFKVATKEANTNSILDAKWGVSKGKR